MNGEEEVAHALSNGDNSDDLDWLTTQSTHFRIFGILSKPYG